MSDRKRVGRPTEPIDAKLARCIDKRGPQECWPWIAARDKDGYGKLSYGPAHQRVHARAHRYVLIMATEDRPGMNACHTCDNPPCCNPAHLFWGTDRDNQVDAAKKGRKARMFGMQNGAYKHGRYAR